MLVSGPALHSVTSVECARQERKPLDQANGWSSSPVRDTADSTTARSQSLACTFLLKILCHWLIRIVDATEHSTSTKSMRGADGGGLRLRKECETTLAAHLVVVGASCDGGAVGREGCGCHIMRMPLHASPTSVCSSTHESANNTGDVTQSEHMPCSLLTGHHTVAFKPVIPPTSWC